MILGSTVDVLNVGGRNIMLVPYSKLQTEMFFIKPSKVGVGPLTNRAMAHTFYGKEGDRVIGEVLGEYVNTCAGAAAEDHKVIYGLKKS